MENLRQDERVAVARLHALLELLPTALDRHLASSGLTSFEFTLLESLEGAELQRLRLSTLASQTNATLPRLSRVVSGLERKGMVTRTPCEEDGRAINAVLTEDGRRAFSEGRARYEDAVRHLVLNSLDDDGIGDLAAMTLSILTTLDPQKRMSVTIDSPACAADPLPRTG